MGISVLYVTFYLPYMLKVMIEPESYRIGDKNNLLCKLHEMELH